jgi:hypothetical protein
MAAMVIMESRGNTEQLLAATDEIRRRSGKSAGLLVRVVAAADERIVLVHVWESEQRSATNRMDARPGPSRPADRRREGSRHPVRRHRGGLARRAVSRRQYQSGPYTTDAAFKYRFVDGRIAERWAVRDDPGTMRQLGAIR